jgi:hypothetical protein
MLFKQIHLQGIREGTISLAYDAACRRPGPYAGPGKRLAKDQYPEIENLGLTISHETGDEISPLGKVVLKKAIV